MTVFFSFILETYVQNVLLNDSVDHNTDEEVEEDTKQVLHPRHVISDLIPRV